MNYFLPFKSSPDYRQTDRQTESDVYEPTVQSAQVGSEKYVQDRKKGEGVKLSCMDSELSQIFGPHP